MINNILVVCVGNVCRSPMAEVLLKQKLGDRQVSVSSAGLGALVGQDIEPQAQSVLEAHGLDGTAHKARQLTIDMIREAELVLVMEEWQRSEITRLDPTARGKVHLLGRWEDFEIDDPYRRSDKVFKDAYDTIARGVGQWIERL